MGTNPAGRRKVMELIMIILFVPYIIWVWFYFTSFVLVMVTGLSMENAMELTIVLCIAFFVYAWIRQSIWHDVC